MPKVLIVDDQAEIRKLWAVNLSARCYDVAEAADGWECLNMIENERPDVILLDLGMPVLSGWAVLEALKEKLLLTQVPVIIVTGWADEGIGDRARQLGAVGALIKPFGVDELLLTIEMALREVGHEREDNFRG